MRSNRSVKHVAIASLLVVAATVALTSGISADPPEDHCNTGNVNSAFQAWAPGVKLWDRGLDYGGLAEGVGLCQYRTFYDGAEVCFCEDDIFLGGTTVYVSPDPPDGMSQSEAREWLAQFETELSITPDGGETSELDVMRTAIKGGPHVTRGQVVYQQYGVFFQLPVGDYTTTYRDYHPDWGGWWEANVRVRVLPHETAHLLGPPSDGGFGSVQCPEE